MSETSEKQKQKKRSAIYYREYRKRKKENRVGEPSQKISSSKRVLLNSLPKTNQWGFIAANLPLCFLVLVLTGWLIHLSSSFYKGSLFSSYFQAGILEVLLLVLVILKLESRLQNFLRGLLVLLLATYSLAPIVIRPIEEAQNFLEAQKNQKTFSELKMNSLLSEIESHKKQAQLFFDRGRLTKGSFELSEVARLELELRNSLATVATVAEAKTPSATIEKSSLSLISYYGLSIQRLLLVLSNLFLVHLLSSLFVQQRKQELQERNKVATRSIFKDYNLQVA